MQVLKKHVFLPRKRRFPHDRRLTLRIDSTEVAFRKMDRRGTIKRGQNKRSIQVISNFDERGERTPLLSFSDMIQHDILGVGIRVLSIGVEGI